MLFPKNVLSAWRNQFSLILFSLFQGRPSRRLAPASAHRRRPSPTSAVESLENRTLLSAATAEVFHVAVNGNNAGDGSEANPWQTLQYAANQVGAGDTVIVHAGTYAGFDLREDGTADERITFRAEDGVLINQRNPITADGINLEGADYVTIEGFRIVGVPRAGIRSVINHHVVIRDNVLDQNGSWGIFTGFSDDLLIENNVATRSVRQHGIYVSNSGDRPIIRGNEIWGNYQNGIHMNGDLSAGGDGIISGALIEQNVIHDNGDGGGAGINADGVQNSRFVNNLLYNNHASGIALYRIDGAAGSSGNTVINNTILNAADSRWAVTINDGSTNNTLLNNIIYNAHSYRGSISVASNSLSGLVSDYNVVMDRFSVDGGDSRVSFSQWQNATGQDQHSIIAGLGELFVDPAGDFHLLENSLAIDAGASQFAPGVDFQGDTRPQGAGIDIGADEFLVNVPPPGPAFSAGFDFGATNSPLAEGFEQATPASLYNSTNGYGWISSQWMGAKNYAGSDALKDDGVVTQGGTFAVDLPNGVYDVTITIGDPAAVSDNLSVTLEDQETGVMSATAGQHTSATYRIEVTDGQLTIKLDDLGGASRYFYLNGIQVQSVGGTPQDQTGPKVTSAEALGAAANTIDGFRITFDEAIPDGGLPLSLLVVTGPNGPILPTGLTRLSESAFEVHVPVQSADGLYTLTVLPLITDQAGNLMDQDGDGTGGEVLEDQFQAIAELFAGDFQAGFDFGAANSPVAQGFQQATPASLYNSTNGYGWISSQWMGTKNYAGSDALMDDAVVTQGATFAVDLPNGVYDVTITIGDPVTASDNLSVSLEDQDAGVMSAAAGQHTAKTYRVQVTDGQLTIHLNDLGGASRYFFLNGVQIRSV